MCMNSANYVNRVLKTAIIFAILMHQKYWKQIKEMVFYLSHLDKYSKQFTYKLFKNCSVDSY